jgi:hypothetical protein
MKLMNEPVEPVFTVEGHDVTIYRSIRDMEHHVEPLDVNVGGAFDARGRRIRLTTDGRRTFAQLAEMEPSSALRFEEILRRDLLRRGEGAATTAGLDDLVEMAGKHIDVPRAGGAFGAD